MRWIFALSLAALLWASSVRTGPVPSHAIIPNDIIPNELVTMAGAEACAVTGDSPDRESDRQWRAARQAIAVISGSVWTSAPVHAELGATRAARIFELARSVSSTAPPPSSAPLYLRHTPLLI